jgi:hypothetical protein
MSFCMLTFVLQKYDNRHTLQLIRSRHLQRSN